MPESVIFRCLRSELTRLGRTYLNYKARPLGNYTRRQLSAAAAYTIFAHAEFETFFEDWALRLNTYAETRWVAGQATKPLVHLCAFFDGGGAPSSVPAKDVWNEPVRRSLQQHRAAIQGNHGIKEENVCRLLAPVGFDTRTIDAVLLGDLSAFGTLRGAHAHQSHRLQLGTAFDPFGRKAKAEGLLASIVALDRQLVAYLASC